MKLRRSDAKAVTRTTNSVSCNNVVASTQKSTGMTTAKCQMYWLLSFLACIQHPFLNGSLILHVMLDILNGKLRRCRRK